MLNGELLETSGRGGAMTPGQRRNLYVFFMTRIKVSPDAGSTATAMVDHVAELLAAELSRLTAEVERLQKIVSDRQHPASEPRDPPEVLRTVGFWPECGCGECYAIHCLDEQMNEVERLRADGDLALDLLAIAFDKIENGDPCYENPDEHEGYIGNAVRLADDTFRQCADLLNRTRPNPCEAIKESTAAQTIASPATGSTMASPDSAPTVGHAAIKEAGNG